MDVAGRAGAHLRGQGVRHSDDHPPGASGGVLQPGIALGSTLGTMLGLLWLFVFPVDSVTACALIGAAALLSASQQAPLMAMCLVMELTEAPIEFFVPVGLAVAASAFVSSWLLRRLS